jgi:DNA-binding NtrC family response regulator
LEHLNRGNRVDLVLSDIVMPGGMSGIDLARTIRERYPQLPMLLTTGYSAAAREAAEEGFIILSKPFRISTLERVIRSALKHEPQVVHG